jgi:hypothetical protein
MTTSDPDKERVAGALRSAFDDQAPAKPKSPGSDVFNRMPKPVTPPQPLPAAARVPVQVPHVRQRLRVAGLVIPLVVAVAGLSSAYVLWRTTKSLPIALVCAGLGLFGAVFCHYLLRDRVEVS